MKDPKDKDLGDHIDDAIQDRFDTYDKGIRGVFDAIESIVDPK